MAKGAIGFALPLLFAGIVLDAWGVQVLYGIAGILCLWGVVVLLFVKAGKNPIFGVKTI